MPCALIFSDIHNDARALEKLMDIDADYYFAAGDLVSWARGLDKMGELMKRRAGKVYVLPGNHESERDIAGLCERHGFVNFHGGTLEVAGVHIAGLGYSSPTPFNTPGEYSEAELATRLSPFAALKPLVLICHAPPLDTPLDRIREGLHAGSRAVREFIERYQPQHFFCGHIHEAEGVVIQMGATRAQNVGKKGYLLVLPSPERQRVGLCTYLITFTCYGAWLHGHEGTVDSDHNLVGSRTLAANDARLAKMKGLMKQEPYTLDAKRRPVVLEAIKATCRHRNWDLLAAHVRTNHVHAIVTAAVKPEVVMSALKAYASRDLRRLDADSKDRRRWTHDGSTRYLWTREEVSAAIHYVVDDQGESMSVFCSGA